MVLQIFVHLFTWDTDGMAVVANFALSSVLGDMPVIPIAIAIVTISFRRSCHDLVFEIGARLNGCGHILSGMFLIHAYQDGGNSIEELIRVRLLNGFGPTRNDGFAYVLGRGGEQPASHSHEQTRGEHNDHGSEPITGGFGFHIF